jgi:hypothetical protein
MQDSIKPSICIREHFRGFENPLPRTKVRAYTYSLPGLKRLRKNSGPGKDRAGAEAPNFSFVYGTTNRACPEPVKLFPETKSSSHADSNALNLHTGTFPRA